jgi:hypothetical protein
MQTASELANLPIAGEAKLRAAETFAVSSGLRTGEQLIRTRLEAPATCHRGCIGHSQRLLRDGPKTKQATEGDVLLMCETGDRPIDLRGRANDGRDHGCLFPDYDRGEQADDYGRRRDSFGIGDEPACVWRVVEEAPNSQWQFREGE